MKKKIYSKLFARKSKIQNNFFLALRKKHNKTFLVKNYIIASKSQFKNIDIYEIGTASTFYR